MSVEGLFGTLGSATFSDDQRYRYILTRRWSVNDDSVATFLMCNPSRATANVNDPSVTRCVNFAKSWGVGGLHIINQYAYQATKPAELWAAGRAGVDIVGPDNDRWIREHGGLACDTGWPLVAAWGAHPKADRIADVLAILGPAAPLLTCLGTTTAGHPRHPLMLRNDTERIPWPREVPA